jgi:cytochrome d ubiquinol oxidase subunit II
VILADALAGAILVALVVYVLLGGADFGGGVWVMLARGPRAREHQRAIAEAIGPVWEANHVWLIAAIVVLFSAFPAAYAAITTVLHVPLTGMLLGVVVRGSAFAFHHYDPQPGAGARRWHRAFALASVCAPLFLGMCVGAVSAGRVHLTDGAPVAGFLTPWLHPFCFAVGALLLAICAALAASYIAVETRGSPLGDEWRTWSMRSAVTAFVVAAGVLAYARDAAPEIHAGIVARPWSPALWAAALVSAAGTFLALRARRIVLGRTFLAAHVVVLLAGWGVAQYPYLVPPSITIAGAAAPPVTLRLVAWTLAGGALLLIPSLGYLFVVFKGRSAFSLTDSR